MAILQSWDISTFDLVWDSKQNLYYIIMNGNTMSPHSYRSVIGITGADCSEEKEFDRNFYIRL